MACPRSVAGVLHLLGLGLRLSCQVFAGPQSKSWRLVRRFGVPRLFSLSQLFSSPRSWQRQRLAVATEQLGFLRLSACQRKRELQRARPQSKSSEPRAMPRTTPSNHTPSHTCDPYSQCQLPGPGASRQYIPKCAQ